MAVMTTHGWSGKRNRRGPVVQVTPVCRGCGSRLQRLPEGVVPAYADNRSETYTTIERGCGKCDTVNRIKVVRCE
jgi:hypothetical protein